VEGSESVVVIPGLNGHPGMLMQAAPHLFPADWQAVPVDHHDDLALDGVVGMAERLLEGIDEPRFWLCGESFGGTVALTAAHLAPHRVRGLILLSTFGWHPSTLARRGQGALSLWSFLGGRVSQPIYQAARLASVTSQLGMSFSAELLTSYLSRPRANVPAYRRKAELSLTFDARPWLSSIACPAFILVGRWDTVVPPSAGRQLAHLLPQAQLYILPGGHLVHLVQAERVQGLLETWRRSDDLRNV
jgi:pimeloyl-ACP methyl ester carboxylesterase